MKIIFLFILLSFLFFACSDEQVIDDTSDTWSVLAASNVPSANLMKIEFPSGTVSGLNLYESANKTKLSSVPRLIVDFGGYFFLLKPDDFQIEVIDNKTYISKHIISFSAENKKPLSIAFAPNATAAYLIFENDTTVAIIDLTVMQVAREINLPGVASSVALSGNQVYVTCPEINKLLVIDTRDNKVKQKIDMPEYPQLVAMTFDGMNIVIVSSGAGKNETTTEKTDAYVTLLDAGTKKEISRQALGVGVVNPKEQVPLTLATAERLYAYIGTKEYLLQFNTRTGAPPARLLNGKYISVLFNDRRNEMIFLRDNGTSLQMLTYNPEDKKYNLDIKLPDGVVNILPI